MSSVKSVNMSNITATPQVNADSSEVHGRMRVWYDVYEATALASGSDITVARLPKGAVVYGVTIMHDALGTGVTIQVGDASDGDRYITSTAAATAGQVTLADDGVIGGFGYQNTSETDVLITTGGAAATGTIKCAITYVVD